jgi:hypothetical protein
VILMATNSDPNVDDYICSGFPRGCGALGGTDFDASL